MRYASRSHALLPFATGWAASASSGDAVTSRLNLGMQHDMGDIVFDPSRAVFLA